MEATTDLKYHLAQMAADAATLAARQTTEARGKIMDQRWYLAHAGGGEKQTQEEFRRSGIEYYYPQTWGQQRVPKRELTPSARKNPMAVMRPVKIGLWKGYYFVRLDLGSRLWREPFERADVHGIVANSEGGRLLPAPVGDGILGAIRDQEVNGAIPAIMRAKEFIFLIGEACRINSGVFSTFDGIIQEEVEKPIGSLDESVKAKLLVSLFGRMCVVEVPICDIEKL